ncbi:MAG: Mobile element protein [Candidatus Jettenia ecosi]|uniref:Mobile element protein n=1 Tax=Candidatus Jettenia ecosi TaxID=2494326 RepID=A0A533Q6Y6_9BACT|nr:MAG: Mobile element protein [Candidatus Jettenia ecosi]
MDLRDSIPLFIKITDGKVHDINILDDLIPEPGFFYIMDRVDKSLGLICDQTIVLSNTDSAKDYP